jgi:hypothetical protein
MSAGVFTTLTGLIAQSRAQLQTGADGGWHCSAKCGSLSWPRVSGVLAALLHRAFYPNNLTVGCSELQTPVDG